jgi:hypothetical protein
LRKRDHLTDQMELSTIKRVSVFKFCYGPSSLAFFSPVEDPFSVLSALVPDPPFHPKLTPLYASTSTIPSKAPSYDPNTPRSSQTPQPTTTFPAAVSVHVPDRRPIAEETPKKHWTITRNATSRNKGKEREEETPEVIRPNREFHATDFGSFGVLGAQLGNIDNEESLRDELKYSLDCERDLDASQSQIPTVTEGYWSTRRAAEAEEYIRDVVYGGVEGLAYVRSLAEFVDSESQVSRMPRRYMFLSVLTSGTAKSIPRQLGCQEHCRSYDWRQTYFVARNWLRSTTPQKTIRQSR